MASGCEAVIMHFILRNVMAFRPSLVVRTEAPIAAPLLHGIRKNVFHTLVAVKLDDLFHRAVLQVHPVEIFPNEDIDPARARTILTEALTPFFDLAALLCGFGVVGINRDFTLHHCSRFLQSEYRSVRTGCVRRPAGIAGSSAAHPSDHACTMPDRRQSRQHPRWPRNPVWCLP